MVYTTACRLKRIAITSGQPEGSARSADDEVRLGRALRKHKPGAWLFLWLILFYPAVYYAVFPHPRYRHPIEPELGILIVYVISEAEKKNRGQKESIEKEAS